MIKQESPFSRWSRRKQQTLQENLAEEAMLEHPPSIDDSSEVPIATTSTETSEVTQEAQLTDADMPDIESLTEDSDFSPFMSAGVSDELRNLALRKLFRAPAFNICDGLDEYDEDYTSFEALGNIITCDMKHQLELEQARREAEAEQDELNRLETDAEATDQFIETRSAEARGSEQERPSDTDTRTADNDALSEDTDHDEKLPCA